MTIAKARPLAEGRKQVLIVDDHPIVQLGLTQLINQTPDLQVCGAAGSAAAALEAMDRRKPDVVIVDLTLENSHGLELVKDIRARYGALPVLVVSMHDENLYAERALRAGAMGYVMKRELTEQVIGALRKVLAGEVHVSPRIAARIMRRHVGGTPPPASPLDLLGDRELEMLRLIGQGLGRAEIAGRMKVSVKTVDSYRESLKEKLCLGSSAALTHYAVQWMQSGTA